MEYDLVFEGGGAKGMVFVGAMQEFEARGHTFKRLLGTSAGAITAVLLAAGFHGQEMLGMLAEKEPDGASVFTRFMAVPPAIERTLIRESATRQLLRQINLPLVPDRLEDVLDDRLADWIATNPNLRGLFSFIEYGGWFSADHFVAWLQQHLDQGEYKGQPRRFSGLSMAQFHQHTGVDFSAIASDTTGERMLVLNQRTAPDVPVVWAVRMSMSIPLLWQAVTWRKEWGTYLGREMQGHEIVDGGLLSNFPIELFVSRDPSVRAVMGEVPGGSVLGMLIDESLPVNGADAPAAVASGLKLGELRTVQRLSGLMNTALSAHDKMVIEAFERFVVRMPAKGYGTTEFGMDDARRGALVQAGKETLRAYFEQAGRDGVSFGAGMGEEMHKAMGKADERARKILEP